MPCKNESVIKAFKDDASTTDTHVSSAWDRRAAEKRMSDVPNLFLLAAKSNFVRYR